MSKLSKTGRASKLLGKLGYTFGGLLLSCALFLVFYTRANINTTRVYAATSSTLNFQARIGNANGSSVPDGFYNIEFKLYDGGTQGGPGGTGLANAGSLLWTETYYDSNGVTAGNDNRVRVVNGYFSVELGSQTAFGGGINWDQEMWLTMNIGGSTQTATPTWDGEMVNSASRRTKLTGVPFAFTADKLDGIDSTGFAQLAPSAVQGVNSASTAVRLNQTGAGDLLQLQGDGADVLTLTKTGNLSTIGDGTFQGGDLTIGTSSQAGNLVIHDGSTHTGSLTVAALAQNTVYTLPDPGGASDTICLQTLANCGSASAILQNGNSFTADVTIGSNDAYNLKFETGGTTHVTLDTSGKLGIGDATPDQLLEVMSSAAANTQATISNTNAGDYDAQIGFELTDGTSSFTMGVDDSDSDKFKISGGGALGTNDYLTVTTAGNIGIGTNTPGSFMLNVAGDTYNSGNLFVGNSTQVSGTNFQVVKTRTDTSGFTTVGYVKNYYAPTAAPDPGTYSLGNWSLTQSGGTSDLTNAILVGQFGQVDHNAAGTTLGRAEGSSFMVKNSNTGTITTAVAGLFANQNTSTGTISTSNGIQVGNVVNSGGGTITNNLGIQIQAQTGATNNVGMAIGEATGTNQSNLVIGQTTIPAGAYSIYNSSTDQNYFAGNLGVGDASPAYAFTVGSGDLSGIDSTGALGIKTGGAAASADFSLGVGADRTINVNAQTTNVTGNALTVKAGNAGTGASAFQGGQLNLQGGNAAGTGNANGGNVALSGGAGVGTGVKGLVVIDTPTFAAATQQNCTSSPCALSQANVDSYSTITVHANATGYIVTLPGPTNTTTGRVVYITAVAGSSDFTLSVNGGGTGNVVAMRQNSTATMVWNGTAWAAAGASSSTTLQAAYDNTLTSAGGAEIVLNQSGGAADGLTVRNNGTTPIEGGIFEVQTSIGTNLLSVNSLGTELAVNGGSETSASFATDWTAAPAGGTITRTTTSGQYITGQAAAQIVTAGTNYGARNNLSANPAVSSTYQVSFAVKLSSGTFTTLDVQYSRDGGTDLEACTNYSTQTAVTSSWTKVTCTITTDATTATNPDLIIRQTDATARTFWVENLSFMRNDSTTQPSNVQIGGGTSGGQVTLFTLDRSTAPPVSDGNTTYLGSMYYDTTSGRIQCYEADGWGACGSAPDNFVNLTPEYPGAVLNGSGVGTMTADFCANGAGLTVNTGLCSSGQAFNFYKWTSPQASQQTYSIYVTYQLPGAFKRFVSNDTVTLTARTDHVTNGVVTYQMFRNESGSLNACGTETTVTTSANAWQTVAINGNEFDGCGFTAASADDFVIFKINVKANSSANVYVGKLSFTTIGQ